MKVSKVLGIPRFTRTVADMRLNEVAYTVPWSFNPKTNELDEKAPIDSDSAGTVVLKVYRNLLGEFEVDLNNIYYEFPN